MADAGLTPAQILADSTLGGARLLGREADIGTIAPVKLADMVLLDADPLAGVANFRRLVAVVKQGDYRPAESFSGDGQTAKTVRHLGTVRRPGPAATPETRVAARRTALTRT